MAQIQRLFAYQDSPDDLSTKRYYRYTDRIPGYGAIKTSGSSTTVTYYSGGALDAYQHPFNDFGVGTIMGVRAAGGQSADLNKVAAVASDQSITIGSAKDYTTPTTAWWYQKRLDGTTSTDGWIYVGQMRTKMIKIVLTAIVGASTGITYSIEMKENDLDTAPAQLITQSIASATALANTATIQIPETCAWLRVGFVQTGAVDTGTLVNCYLTGQIGAAESAN